MEISGGVGRKQIDEFTQITLAPFISNLINAPYVCPYFQKEEFQLDG